MFIKKNLGIWEKKSPGKTHNDKFDLLFKQNHS